MRYLYNKPIKHKERASDTCLVNASKTAAGPAGGDGNIHSPAGGDGNIHSPAGGDGNIHSPAGVDGNIHSPEKPSLMNKM